MALQEVVLKISSFLCTYDDCEYLDQAIESFKWFPDKLYIIEGAWKSAQQYGKPSTSQAETYKIINKHVDNKRVFLIQANEARERDQRQIGLERAKQDGADWCFMLDSDEVYPRQALKGISMVLKTAAPSFAGFRLKSYNFINGFTRWYDGDYKRIYRVTPQAKFVMDNDVSLGSPLRWWTTPVIEAKSCRFYHYNYVKQRDAQFWRKMHYQNEQDPTFNERLLPQYGSDGSGHYKIPDDIPIYDFKGKHPAIMREHPYFKNNIYNETGIEFQDE